MFSYLPLVLRNAARNRRRTALTVASVAVSLGLLGLPQGQVLPEWIAAAAPASFQSNPQLSSEAQL
jgi:hypothetical protein